MGSPFGHSRPSGSESHGFLDFRRPGLAILGLPAQSHTVFSSSRPENRRFSPFRLRVIQTLQTRTLFRAGGPGCCLHHSGDADAEAPAPTPLPRPMSQDVPRTAAQTLAAAALLARGPLEGHSLPYGSGPLAKVGRAYLHAESAPLTRHAFSCHASCLPPLGNSYPLQATNCRMSAIPRSIFSSKSRIPSIFTYFGCPPQSSPAGHAGSLRAKRAPIRCAVRHPTRST